MDGAPHDILAALVDSVRTRSPGEAAALRVALTRHWWPGGMADRSEPAALPWVRQWGAALSAPLMRACSCAAGRCAVCN
jgi:hypothetical protein